MGGARKRSRPDFFLKGALIIATTTLIPLHASKGRSISAALGRSTDYVKNPDKTNAGELISAYECDPLTVDVEFNFSKSQYAAITGRDYGKQDVLAYHLRQSFKPGEVDADTANRIGYDLALKLTKGNHAFICCTHVDRAHVHSHIIFNSTSLDCTRKFRNFYNSSFAIRRISDRLCVENGLSIIENPQPSKGKTYGKWLGENKPPSKREKLEQIIDTALGGCKDYTSFIEAMQAAGCEVKRGKYLAFKAPGQSKFIRCKSLGDDYTEDAIRERSSGKRVVTPKQKSILQPQTPTKPNMLIDIEAKLQQARSPGFEHWARLFNLKESARTLIFLQERGLTEYAMLERKTNLATRDFNANSDRRKEIDARMKEIAELQKHIGTYSKTKDIFAEYSRLKKQRPTAFEKLRGGASPAEKFYVENESAIISCRSAKKFFDESGFDKDKKMPRMDSLKKEYAMLVAEQKKLYSGYKAAREEMVALLMAKQNVDRILNGTPAAVKNLERGVR